MIEIEIAFLVERPIQHVFEIISDIANCRWVSDHSNFFIENELTSKGPVGLDTTSVERLKWLGKNFGEIDQGLMGLYDQPKPGAPRTFSDEQVAQLFQKTLKKKPDSSTGPHPAVLADGPRLC